MAKGELSISGEGLEYGREALIQAMANYILAWDLLLEEIRRSAYGSRRLSLQQIVVRMSLVNFLIQRLRELRGS